MRNLSRIFGRSPFEPIAEHARKVHDCVSLLRPIADAIIAGDRDKLDELQHEMSRTEYEADQLKDRIRQRLPKRYFLPVRREDVAMFISQLDKIADDAEDFAVVASFRAIHLSEDMVADFLALVDKVVQVSESLLGVAEHLAQVQKESFAGPDVEDVLAKIQQVCHMEWESDKLSRKFARRYYTAEEMDAMDVLILEKLCRALGGVADHAENVGKNLRLMIIRK